MGKRFDIQGAAEYLDVPISTLKYGRAKGTGPEFIKLGKRIYYTEDDLIIYFESRRMKQTTPRKSA